MTALIRSSELNSILGRVKMIDASYGLPPMPVRIGNAVDFDIDTVADPDGKFAHTLPSPDLFAAHVSRMGISSDDDVVVYDRAGMHMAAARVWWMFRVFGHDKVRILDGGFPAWVAEGYPLQPKPDEDAAEEIKPGIFKASFRPELFKEREDISANIDKNEFTVLDARDAKRYSGEAPEPRPGIESGHIPGSLNVPFAGLIDPETGLMKDKSALGMLIAESGMDGKKPVAISCGSGVTACVVALALHELGREDAAIYGGSWTEWGSDPALPKAKGIKP